MGGFSIPRLYLEGTWRIGPQPQDGRIRGENNHGEYISPRKHRVVLFPFQMAYSKYPKRLTNGGDPITTYKSWDDPPSTVKYTVK